jgi:hypothetical protein
MKFVRLVGCGCAALLLMFGAGSLTPLRADCPPGTVWVTGYGCYTSTNGEFVCDENYGLCVEIPWWTNPALGVPRFNPPTLPVFKKPEPVKSSQPSK